MKIQKVQAATKHKGKNHQNRIKRNKIVTKTRFTNTHKSKQTKTYNIISNTIIVFTVTATLDIKINIL